jgi:hypothetical protein
VVVVVVAAAAAVVVGAGAAAVPPKEMLSFCMRFFHMCNTDILMVAVFYYNEILITSHTHYIVAYSLKAIVVESQQLAITRQ